MASPVSFVGTGGRKKGGGGQEERELGKAMVWQCLYQSPSALPSSGVSRRGHGVATTLSYLSSPLGMPHLPPCQLLLSLSSSFSFFSLLCSARWESSPLSAASMPPLPPCQLLVLTVLLGRLSPECHHP